MNTLAQTTFDYASLAKADRAVVEQKTTEIRDRMGRAAQNIIEIGERLLVVKDRIGEGDFHAWLRSEFDWDRTTAWRMMSVADKFGRCNLQQATIAPSALYLLASPSTPDEVRNQFIDDAKNGKPVTHAAVKSALTQQEIDAQKKWLDDRDPLLAKHREAQDKPKTKRSDDDDLDIGNDFPAPAKREPETWGGRTIPADAPPLNLDVSNDPSVRWTSIIRDIQGCVARLPSKNTLSELPAAKRKYIAERFDVFAKQMKEAV